MVNAAAPGPWSVSSSTVTAIAPFVNVILLHGRPASSMVSLEFAVSTAWRNVVKSPGSSPQLVTADDATNDGAAGLTLLTAGLPEFFAAKAPRRLWAIDAPLNGCIAGAEGCAASTDSPITKSEAKTAASGLSCGERSRSAFVLHMTNLQ